MSPMPADSLPTRASLLRRLRDLSDVASWREFYERYRRFIFQAARRSGLGAEDAEEVLQDTVVSVAKGLPNFVYKPEECSFKGWLMILVRRRIADQFRRLGRQVRQVDFSGELPTAAAPAETPFEPIWEEEWERNLMLAAIDRLRLLVSPRNYQIFDWTARQGRSAGETAAAFGVSVILVRVVKMRVLRQLQKQLRQLRSEPWPRRSSP